MTHDITPRIKANPIQKNIAVNKSSHAHIVTKSIIQPTVTIV